MMRVGAAVGAALIIGVVAAATSPLLPAGAIVALGVLGLIWWRPIVGIALFVVVVATLPFGVIPVPLAGAQLTFVDAVLIATFLAVLARVVFSGAGLTLDAPAVAVVNEHMARHYSTKDFLRQMPNALLETAV